MEYANCFIPYAFLSRVYDHALRNQAFFHDNQETCAQKSKIRRRTPEKVPWKTRFRGITPTPLTAEAFF
jgi:hypothetical protein